VSLYIQASVWGMPIQGCGPPTSDRTVAARFLYLTLAQKRGQLLHLAGEAFKRVLECAAIHAAQHDEAGFGLHKRTRARTIEAVLCIT
jgi:hypothetical protein